MLVMACIPFQPTFSYREQMKSNECQLSRILFQIPFLLNWTTKTFSPSPPSQTSLTSTSTLPSQKSPSLPSAPTSTSTSTSPSPSPSFYRDGMEQQPLWLRLMMRRWWILTVDRPLKMWMISTSKDVDDFDATWNERPLPFKHQICTWVRFYRTGENEANIFQQAFSFLDTNNDFCWYLRLSV